MDGKEQTSFLGKYFSFGKNKFSTPLATKDHPSDKAIIFLQDLFESHRKDLEAMQYTVKAQELIIELLKIPNEEKTQDTYKHGVKSLYDEVEFKSLCDLMSIQTWQIRCAVNGFEKLTNWLCNAKEASEKNPFVWMRLKEQLKSTNESSTTTSTKTVTETIDAIRREIAEINEKYKHVGLEQKPPKTDGDRQDYDKNDNYQVLKDDVHKLKETNSQLLIYLSHYDEGVKKRFDIECNLKQMIDEWRKMQDKDQPATFAESSKPQLDDSQRSEQDPIPPNESAEDKEKRDSDEAKEASNVENGQSESVGEDHECDNVAKRLQELFGCYQKDLDLVLKIKCALKRKIKLLSVLKADQNQYAVKDQEARDKKDVITSNQLMQYLIERLPFVEEIKDLFCNEMEKMILHIPAWISTPKEESMGNAHQGENKKPSSPVYSRLIDKRKMLEIKENVSKEIDTINELGLSKKTPTSRGGYQTTIVLELVKRIHSFVLSYKKDYEKVLEKEIRLIQDFEKSKNKNGKASNQTVNIQIYHERDDEIMRRTAKDICDKIKERLKECKIDHNIMLCNAPDELKSNTIVLVLCINTSSLGTDIASVMETVNIKDQNHVSLIDFQHIDVNVCPIQKGVCVEHDGIDCIHHMAFQHEKGIYECNANTVALNDIVSFIKRSMNGTPV